MMTTWEECHKAGMSAIDAARTLGKSHNAANKWAKNNRVKWRPLTREEFAERIRRGMAKSRKPVKPRQVNTLGTPRVDSLAMPPAQDRIGGNFWMENSKTGQRILRRSLGAIYHTAMIMGWTDWEWGEVK